MGARLGRRCDLLPTRQPRRPACVPARSFPLRGGGADEPVPKSRRPVRVLRDIAVDPDLVHSIHSSKVVEKLLFVLYHTAYSLSTIKDGNWRIGSLYGCYTKVNDQSNNIRLERRAPYLVLVN